MQDWGDKARELSYWKLGVQSSEEGVLPPAPRPSELGGGLLQNQKTVLQDGSTSQRVLKSLVGAECFHHSAVSGKKGKIAEGTQLLLLKSTVADVEPLPR